jgi:UDP-N-acetylglucosamine transferase subunit ALG13
VPTPVKINNPDAKRLKVLIAPLDWGLGHVTRCIPIIKELINQKCIVVAAVSGVQRTILLREIPDLAFVELPGYGVKYGKNRAMTVLQLICSIPKILIRVNREKAWLRVWIRQERPDLIISDNRYGLYSKEVVSIFITHQLLIRTPLGSVADRILQRVNYAFIRRYALCWVPDAEGSDGLAGELSHPVRLPDVPVRYIGWLSRFGGEGGVIGEGSGYMTRIGEGADRSVGSGVVEVGRQGRDAGPGGTGFDLLVLLSGPEPQRTLLEKKILEQVTDYPGRVVLVRGLPDGGDLPAPPRVAVYNHLPAAELEVVIRGAGLVICRSGYSTVMDLMRLGKRAILVPTPGQTEQEYLGNYLAQKGWAICIEQDGFFLADAMAGAEEQQMAAADGQQKQKLPDTRTGEQLLKKEIMDVIGRLSR